MFRHDRKNAYRMDTVFSVHKKKDDLADCFLQGMWYIQNKV